MELLATDIDIDPNCNTAMDPDMAISGSTGQDFTMALGVRAVYAHQEAAPLQPLISSSASLHSVQIVLHLWLAHLSSTSVGKPHGRRALGCLPPLC